MPKVYGSKPARFLCMIQAAQMHGSRTSQCFSEKLIFQWDMRKIQIRPCQRNRCSKGPILVFGCYVVQNQEDFCEYTEGEGEINKGNGVKGNNSTQVNMGERDGWREE
jgi:hypothetical protein